jgi:hypothetical protein
MSIYGRTSPERENSCTDLIQRIVQVIMISSPAELISHFYTQHHLRQLILEQRTWMSIYGAHLP